MKGKRIAGLYARGLAMGAADVVPGVSGGTVAFITGIYEELIDSIKSIEPSALKVLFQQGFAAFWLRINGTFLLALMLGIATSVLTLARMITYLLETYPLQLWSFFFGLILASSWHIWQQIKAKNLQSAVALVLGAIVAFAIGELKPSEVDVQPLMVFAAGCIAICAMILPGISGSFILVLLGMYSHILEAIKSFNLELVATFAAGCGLGLLSFAHLLSWLFKRFHDTTLALLTGFLIGSLNLVWPWKQTLSFYVKDDGEKLALEQTNLLPGTYEAVVGANSHVIMCSALIVLGVILVLTLEKVGASSSETRK